IAAALGKLADDKRRVYVCEGVYDEDVVLGSSHKNVTLLGGFACDWSPSGAKPTIGKSQMALKISGATGVGIGDLAFVAKSAVEDGGSSIAAFVANAEVTFKRVALTAGDGKKGRDGANGEFTFPTAEELKGIDGDDGGGERKVT